MTMELLKSVCIKIAIFIRDFCRNYNNDCIVPFKLGQNNLMYDTRKKIATRVITF